MREEPWMPTHSCLCHPLQAACWVSYHLIGMDVALDPILPRYMSSVAPKGGEKDPAFPFCAWLDSILGIILWSQLAVLEAPSPMALTLLSQRPRGVWEELCVVEVHRSCLHGSSGGSLSQSRRTWLRQL